MHPIQINLPNGRRVTFSHICDITIPGLPITLTGHIVPDMTMASLLVIWILCKAGCIVVFDDKTCCVYYKGKLILMGYKDPTSNLWMLPIGQDKLWTTPASNSEDPPCTQNPAWPPYKMQQCTSLCCYSSGTAVSKSLYVQKSPSVQINAATTRPLYRLCPTASLDQPQICNVLLSPHNQNQYHEIHAPKSVQPTHIVTYQSNQCRLLERRSAPKRQNHCKVLVSQPGNIERAYEMDMQRTAKHNPRQTQPTQPVLLRLPPDQNIHG
jgi:hypothetical protein